MAEFGSLYGGYLAKNQMNRQEEGQDLARMGALQGLLMKAQAMQEQEKIKGVLAQSGGDPKVAMQALISAGTPQSLELASKLHSLIPDPSQAALRQAQAQKAQVETAEGLGRIQGQRGLADLLNPANASLYTQGDTPNKMFANEDQAKRALIEAERTGTPFSGVVPNQGSLQSLLMQAQPKETATAMARSMFAPPQRGVVVGPGAAYIPPGQTAPAHVQPFAPRAETPRTEFAKLNEDLKTGRITQEQFDAASRTRLGDNSVIPEESSNLTGDDYLKTLPVGMQNTVKGIVEGRIPITSFSIRNNQRDAMLQRAMQYDPTFEAGKAPARMAVQKDFTSGVAARNVTAINTAIRHLGTLNDLGEALKNGDIRVVNAAVNRVATELGMPEVSNFEQAQSAVGNELMRVFRQVGAHAQETKDWEAKFPAKASPEQLKGAVKTAVELLDGRIKALDEQWMRGMDTDKGYPNLLTPTARDILARVGGNPRRRESDARGAAPNPVAPPLTNAKGWKLMTDAKGNKAYVGPNNEIEEVR